MRRCFPPSAFILRVLPYITWEVLNIETLEIVLICALIAFALLNIASFFAGIAYRKKIAEAEFGSAEKQAKNIIDEAVKSADAKKRELLLEAKDFDEICTDNKLDKDYIFYYSIDYNEQSVEMVKHISEKLNKPVYIIFSTNKTYSVYFKGFKLAKNNAPGDFINLIKNASLILSTSFHGVALSVIYRKPFFALRTRDYTDARINDLLTEIELKNRYIDYGDFKELDYSAPVNYNEEAIKGLRDYSLNYLKECLND